MGQYEIENLENMGTILLLISKVFGDSGATILILYNFIDLRVLLNTSNAGG
jgi:hypothetical protein